MMCQFFIKICLIFGTDGSYCVTKGKISCLFLLSCLSAKSLSVNFISDRVLSIRLHGCPLANKRVLKFEIFSSKVAFEEFVLRSLRASPFTNPILTLGG